MTVAEAIKMLNYGTYYVIKGLYRGKVYHRSYENSDENLNKYLSEKVGDAPFSADICGWHTVVVIWMKDYDFCFD